MLKRKCKVYSHKVTMRIRRYKSNWCLWKKCSKMFLFLSSKKQTQHPFVGGKKNVAVNKRCQTFIPFVHINLSQAHRGANTVWIIFLESISSHIQNNTFTEIKSFIKKNVILVYCPLLTKSKLKLVCVIMNEQIEEQCCSCRVLPSPGAQRKHSQSSESVMDSLLTLFPLDSVCIRLSSGSSGCWSFSFYLNALVTCRDLTCFCESPHHCDTCRMICSHLLCF